MNILFVHQNFPAQFKHLAPALASLGHKVVALSMSAKSDVVWNGVQVRAYKASRNSSAGIHPWVSDFETKVIRAEACFRAALQLRSEGFQPDVIVAHHGWGESLFLKDVWPKARMGLYCEFYYRTEGADTGFDPEFERRDDGETCRLRLKNLNNLMHEQVADAGISPTHWQASTFEEPFRSRITVVHDGIDTQRLRPSPNVAMTVRTAAGAQIQLTRADEVVTFVNRNLEPYRGYHTFMRALPRLLSARPASRVLIVGSDGVSYGARPPQGRTWKDIFISEVRPQLTDEQWSRVHFLGYVGYEHFVPLLQLSRVHVYLTYPFVLSWSLLEAMSCGCAIVASDTKPLHEAIKHGETGRLVNFFDAAGLADSVAELLSDAGQRLRLGAAAREFARAHYDLATVCLPRQLEWVQALASAA